MRVLLIGAGKRNTDRVREILEPLLPTRDSLTIINSRKQINEWFMVNEPPELIIADTEFDDGDVFSIPGLIHSHVPVVYVTSDDRIARDAFDHNGIACVKKPVSAASLLSVLYRYRRMQQHFHRRMDQSVSSLLNPPQYHQRVLVKKGREFRSIPLAEIACFRARYKMIYAVNRQGKDFRVVTDKMDDLSRFLDPSLFFRANRQYILHIDYIKMFTMMEFGKILVELSVNVNEGIVVSQTRGPGFRRWVEISGTSGIVNAGIHGEIE